MCDGQILASLVRLPVEHRYYPEDETWWCVSGLYMDFSRAGTHALLASLALGKTQNARSVWTPSTPSSRTSQLEVSVWREKKRSHRHPTGFPSSGLALKGNGGS